jgi:hypothetical protein
MIADLQVPYLSKEIFNTKSLSISSKMRSKLLMINFPRWLGIIVHGALSFDHSLVPQWKVRWSVIYKSETYLNGILVSNFNQLDSFWGEHLKIHGYKMTIQYLRMDIVKKSEAVKKKCCITLPGIRKQDKISIYRLKTIAFNRLLKFICWNKNPMDYSII